MCNKGHEITLLLLKSYFMKSQGTLLIVILILLCTACENKSKLTDQAYSRPYPHIDTIKIGLQSDSGHYAILTYYKKYTGKDTSMMEGSEFTSLGNEKWKVITISEQRD